ncbi:MAG TPA: sugar-binding protein [Gemmatales bacterium]|mgnify:CR=1 FL=1|nr:sugar-binding protein [Gemmatales bacterium]HMP17607.1 sugar-binding protein [Gemmatales bacterium]
MLRCIFALSLFASMCGCSKPAATAVVPKAETDIRVTFISNNAHEFWKLAEIGVRQAGKDLGVKVDFRMPAKASADEQRQIIEDLITQGCRHFAVSPNDPENQADFYNSKAAEGVTFITVDNDLLQGSKRLCFLGTDNFEAGKSAGELVKKAIPDGGKVAIFVGKLDNLNARQRRNGVIAALADLKTMEEADALVRANKVITAGKYTILETLTDNAQITKCKDNVEDVITKNPDVACMVGLWAYNAPQILLVAKEKKLLGKLKIISFDEQQETLDGIRAGEIEGTIVQQPYEFGYQSVKTLVEYAKGNKDVLPEDPNGMGYIAHNIIDKSNIDEFEKKLAELKSKK